MFISVNHFKKINRIFTVIYILFIVYSLFVQAFMRQNDFPVILHSVYFWSYSTALDFSISGISLFFLFPIIFLGFLFSLFTKKRKLKNIFSFLLEVLVIIDIILSLPRTPWCHYSLQIEGYMIGCILLDCLFFILIAVGIFVDGKIVALEKRTEHD